MREQFKIQYIVRQPGKAQASPDPDYPDGIELEVIDASLSDEERAHLPTCKAELEHPAPGLGLWLIECRRCRNQTLITTAGRADDPRSITFTCKRGMN